MNACHHPLQSQCNARGIPRDDVVDIITRDIYPPDHMHTACAEEYRGLTCITSAQKLCGISECGSQPSVDAIIQERVAWCWFMTWSNSFGASEQHTDNKQLIANYHSPHAITFDQLPDWKSFS